MPRSKEEQKEYYQQWYQKNKEKESARQRKRYEGNKERELARHIEWQKNNREKINEYSRQRRSIRREEKALEPVKWTKKDQQELEFILGDAPRPNWMRLTPEEKQTRKEAAKQRAKERTKQYKKTKGLVAERKRARMYQKRRMQRDPLFKLRQTISRRIALHLLKKGYTKKSITQEILGIDYTGFLQHIEAQFEPWMNWDNYGKYESGKQCVGWDIDHIMPISTARTEEELIRLNHYTNLRPLCSYDNRVLKAAIDKLL